MVKFARADIFKATHNLILVTTNSYLRTDGALVMGRGAASGLALREPLLPFVFGKMIAKRCGHLGVYGLLINNHYGIFQVKRHYLEDASLDLIKLSAGLLAPMLAQMQEANPAFTVGMNYPGIGFGNLVKSQVEPLIASLPDSLTIYEKPA